MARILHSMSSSGPRAPDFEKGTMQQGDVQDRKEKMQRLRGSRRYTWTHPAFLIAIALILAGYASTFW